MSTRMIEQIKKLADHVDTNYESIESIDEEKESIDEEVSEVYVFMLSVTLSVT